MKRRLISYALVLALCLSICGNALAANASTVSTKQAGGSCYINHSGKSVSYGGNSSSAQVEDTISVRVKLMEKQSDGTWRQVGNTAYSSKSNSSYVTAGKSYTVSGGHYYKVVATHYSLKNGVGHTTTSTTSSVWIGA
jgi:hypothetical protein